MAELRLPPPMNARKRKRTPKQKTPITVTQQGTKLLFSRPVREIQGLGKYSVAPEQAIIEAPKQRAKKRAYKARAKAAESGNWWDSLINKIPETLGTIAPFVLKALTGFGEYTVNSNSILAGATGGGQGSELPMMMNTKVSNVIRHREFIRNVIGSTTDFSITTLPINPGLDETFPWLYLIANCFSSYRILGMVIEFKSLASDFTTNTYLGYVAMGTQYNSLEPVFPDKETLENSEYSNSTKPSKNLVHPIECSPAQQVLTQLYIRAGAAPTSSDIRMYDLGKFSIATGGQQANGIIGELWATYEVEFYQPKLVKNFGSVINSDHWYTQGITADGTDPFGTARSQSNGGTMAGSTMSNSIYTFPSTTGSGVYRCTISWDGGATVLVAPTVTFANATGKNLVQTAAGLANNVYAPQNGLLATKVTLISYINVVGPSAQIIIGTGGTLPSTAKMDFMLTQIPTILTDYEKKLRLKGYKDPTFQVTNAIEHFRKLQKQMQTLQITEISSSSEEEEYVENSIIQPEQKTSTPINLDALQQLILNYNAAKKAGR